MNAQNALRVIIVDDEPLAREKIRGFLANDTAVEIVQECGDGRRAVNAIRRHAPDLVFLDVQMPERDGFSVIEAVGADRMPPVIFVTAHDQYAVRAFDVHAMDYLLKPFDRERFHEALDRARAQIDAGRTDAQGEQLAALLAAMRAGGASADRLAVKTAGRVVFVPVNEIDYVEAAGNYVRLHVGREAHLMRETMNGMEGRLDTGRFVRTHRSIIVNVERIKELQPAFHGDYVILLKDGRRLNLSRTHRERFERRLGKLE